MEKVTIVGLGYIGLPTAIICAQSGYKVSGFDIDQDKINKINKAISPILETGITEKLKKIIKSGNLKASNNINKANIFLVAVPTPFIIKNKKNNNLNKIKQVDLSYVFNAAKEISKVLEKNNLVILESTVSVGATEKFAKILEKHSGLKLSKDFYVAHCPERVLPGKIFEELTNNNRVIGGICPKASELAKKFYSKFVMGNILITDAKTAEMTKLIENSYRDVNIAFANQVAAMANSAGINPYKLIDLANMHPRVNILTPGCGVGGHCIAVDPWFLVSSFPKDSLLLKTARDINDKKPEIIIKNILKLSKTFYKKNKVIPKILSLGLTFKPDIDDLRESPALKISKKLNLQKKKLKLSVFEPNINKIILDNLDFKNFNNLREAINWADIILILVSHDIFFELKNINLKDKIIIDESGLIYRMYKN
ncbi:MAG: NDP-N-acetyl-D-galactosaminuronic acid dehydrogenase [candidate division TM6 bacterium GW2011_GWF2_28_16]|nr:MAG: NDP-N-acetyl-D-galactosaminuronic acid dehydrogenase [candidate division TM6 bacterium GW2011_GWF2_28_16]